MSSRLEQQRSKVLAISGSPREDGNTEVLLRAALEGAEAAGAETELLACRDLDVRPCIACNWCFKHGTCRFTDDDFAPVLEKLLSFDRIIFGSPVFFMTVSAQAKLLIDRCQCLWSRKYIMKEPVIDPPRERRGMVIAVGGSRGKKMFDGLHWTMRHWFDVLDMRFVAALYVNQVDARGDAPKHTKAIGEARRLGQALAGNAALGAEKTERVELFEGIPAE